MTEIKMYCIFARESLDKINGIRGKMASQAGHAFLHAYWDAMNMNFPNKVAQAVDYRHSERAKKVTLVVDTVEQLVALRDAYREVCGVSLVTDAGLTVFKEPTTTCLGIGPISENNVGDDLKSLTLLI